MEPMLHSTTHVGKSLEFASRYPLEGEPSPRRKKRSSTPPSPHASPKETMEPMLPRSPTHVGKSLEFASRYPLEGEPSPRRKKRRKKKSKKSYDQNAATAKDKIKQFMDKMEREDNSSGGAAFPSSNPEDTGGARMFTGSLDSNQQSAPPAKLAVDDTYIDPLDDGRFAVRKASVADSEISALSNLSHDPDRSPSPPNHTPGGIPTQQIEGHFDRDV